MTTALSVNSFAELVQRSRLLSADKVQKVLDELEAEGAQIETPEALADALVQRDLLTSWQAGFLLKGKHNGFFLGPYRFLRMLGKGGMGAVYLAEHQMMRRRCAIKVLPTKLISESSSVLERFYLEAQAVAALDDPNIVRAYDVNKEVQGKREIHYLVMEYVDGCDLQLLVQRQGPLNYVQVADFARQAASGLAHAHECGLIHRDIKPANLLIDEKGTVKILDLGLARFFDDRLDASLTTTHNESILGTADYLSPEQALDSHNVDTRTDIYSLGCTCYYMLTGHPPFPEGSVAQRLMSHQTKSPTAIEKIRTDAPTDLVTIVEKMIAKSPDNRYQTAREVADAFTAWLAKHASDDWKKEHREVVEAAVSTRHEPTRARSAATEETDLELGLAPEEEELGLAPTEDQPAPAPLSPGSQTSAPSPAPTAKVSGESRPAQTFDTELGLDQLEELEPLSPGLDAGSPSGGLDNLLNEALDNYPALDSNPNLAAFPVQPAMTSVIQRSDKTTLGAVSSNQLLRLVLVGFAVSIPLAIAILVVFSNWSATPAGSSAGVASAVVPAEPTPVSQDPAGEPPSSAPPVAMVPEEPPLARPDDGPQSDNAAANVPSSPSGEVPAANSSTPAPPETVATTTVTPRTTNKTPTPDAGAGSPATPPPSPVSAPDAGKALPELQPSDTPPTAGTIEKTDDRKETRAESEPGPPSPQRIRELLGSIPEVLLKFDRQTTRQSYAYDAMVIREAQETLQLAGLKSTTEAEDTPAAVMTLSFVPTKKDQYFVFNLGAALKCRDGESTEVTVWQQQAEVGQTKAITPTPSPVLRKNVSDFFTEFGKEYRRIMAGND